MSIRDLGPYPTSNKKIDLILAVAILIGCAVFAAYSINQNTGTPPDKNVLAAAAQVSPKAVVGNSKFSWFSGCDRSDSRVYSVTVDGVQEAIVCQGSVIRIFGPTKAPTLRYAKD